MKKRQSILSTALFTFTLPFSPVSFAASWAETGDAGDLTTSAQTPLGGGVLDQISGIVTDSHDVDLYRIFINDPAAFSATTIAGDPDISVTNELDAALALFDATGRGVYYNDDGIFDNANAILPSGDLLSPTSTGVYFLAVFDDDGLPLSGAAVSLDDLIFPIVDSPFTDVVGPTGDGGALPLSGWGFDPDTPIDFDNDIGGLDGEYIVNLTGAQFVVPIPAALWLFGSGLLGLIGISRRKKAA
jgi:hypothetical protein